MNGAKPGSEPTGSLWQEVGQGVVAANLLLTLVVVGSQAAMLKWTGLDNVLEMGQVFWQTAPLSIAVGIIGFWLLYQYEHGDFHPWAMAGVAAASLAAATWIANQCGDLRVTEADPAIAGSIDQGLWTWLPRYSAAMLVSYYRGYGQVNFCSSLVVGGLLGWTWLRILKRVADSPASAAAVSVTPNSAATAQPEKPDDAAKAASKRRRRSRRAA